MKRSKFVADAICAQNAHAMFSSYTDDEKWAMFDHMAVIVTNANSATYDAIESADLRGFFRIFREVADAMRSGSLGEMALSAGTSSMAPAGAMEFGGLMSARMSLQIFCCSASLS